MAPNPFKNALANGLGGGNPQHEGRPDFTQTDGRINPNSMRTRHKTQWADTAHERQAAGVNQRHQKSNNMDINTHNEQDIGSNMLQAAFVDRTMGKAAKDLAAIYERQQLEEQGFVKDEDGKIKRKKKKVKEDSDVDSEEEDNKLAERGPLPDGNQDEDMSLEALRAKRLAAMKKKQKKLQDQKNKGHGNYEFINQDEFLGAVTGSYRCVVHFYTHDIDRCKIFDHHLKLIAKKVMDTKFVALDAAKAPFFVEKLGVRTIPTLAVFRDGVAIHKHMGFAGLPSDEFKTWQLARILSAYDGIEEDVDTDEEFE